MANLTITRDNAKLYIARIMGGGGQVDPTAIAEESLVKGFSDWQIKKDWEFLLKDMSLPTTVASCVLSGASGVVNAPSTGAFDGLNIGITVSGTGVAANTTILSYTRNADGTIATITLSSTPSAGTVTLTFGGTLPIIAGVSDYNLPVDFFRHYGVRLTTTLLWPLEFIRPRHWNRVTLDQTVQGPPSLYTIFNAYSNLTQNKGTYRLRVYPTPKTNDTAKLEYYRRFDPLADPLDMDSANLYPFLDYCRGLAVATKRAFDDPQLALTIGADGLKAAMEKDEDATEDDDVRMKSQMEMGGNARPLWNNGAFWPEYGW